MKEGIELPNHEKNRRLRETETYKYLGILEVDTIKQAEIKEKNQNRVSQENKKITQTQTIQQKSHLKG